MRPIKHCFHHQEQTEDRAPIIRACVLAFLELLEIAWDNCKAWSSNGI